MRISEFHVAGHPASSSVCSIHLWRMVRQDCDPRVRVAAVASVMVERSQPQFALHVPEGLLDAYVVVLRRPWMPRWIWMRPMLLCTASLCLSFEFGLFSFSASSARSRRYFSSVLLSIADSFSLRLSLRQRITSSPSFRALLRKTGFLEPRPPIMENDSGVQKSS